MSRRLLGLGLLLSVGVNLGVLAMVFLRTAPDPTSEAGTTPVEPAVEVAPSDPPVLDPPVLDPVPARPDPPADPPEIRPAEPEIRRPVPSPEHPADPGLGRGPTVEHNPAIELRLDRLATELGLAGERRQEFDRIQRQFLRAAWDHRATLRRAEAEMRRELLAREPDRARLAASQRQIEEARQNLDAALVDTVLRTREILDPAQEAIYMRVLGRLRMAAIGGPQRPGLERPQRGQERPPRRRPRGRDPWRPPG